jgi:hypothetical protein
VLAKSQRVVAGVRSAKHASNRLLHDSGIEMAVTLPLFFGLMADHLVDHPLIHPALANAEMNECRRT